MNGSDDKLDNVNAAPAKRGAQRDSLYLNAILRFPHLQQEGEVRVRNLSEGGLMAIASIHVSTGDLAEVHLRNIGWISGHVAWATEGRIGIAFDHPIDPKTARHPVGNSNLDLPPHLKKLNQPHAFSKFRRP